ncbi:MAG TPA: hypothetical protein PLO67_13500 [Saprospiraceae bacterium]|jgi:hypothetical protein|nr:hypothetical protein [Saprospiraceae bacterium]HPI07070.1 hypothetical protein [Saprospiraceae bacterium]
MKFESLNGSKFTAFQSNEIQDSFKIVGGAPTSTSYRGSDGTSGSDCLDTATSDGSHTINGTGVDYNRGSC